MGLEQVRLLYEKPPFPAVSVSQEKLWLSCRRAWGWSYLDGLKTTSEAQGLGSTVHKRLEEWLKHGVVPDELEVYQTSRGPRYPGRIARAGLSLLPKPGTCLVEYPFYLQLEPGVVFYGIIDALADTRVIDHKTCTSFDWMLTSKDLKEDVQAVVYSAVACLLGINSPIAEWIYYRTTSSPEARVVRVSMPRDAVFGRLLGEVLPVAREIVEARKTLTSGLQLPCSLNHCSKYGGCPHVGRCQITLEERMISAMGFDMEAFAKAQQALGRSGPSTTPPPAPAEEKVPQSPPAPPDPPSPPVVESVTVPAPPQEPLGDMSTWSRAQLKAKAMDLHLVDSSSRVGRESLLEMLQMLVAPSQLGVQEAPLEPPEPQQPSAAPPEPPQPSAAPEAPQAPPTAYVPSPGARIGILYVDCYPLSGERPERLSTIIAEANAQICSGADHYRLEEEYRFTAAAAISSAVARYLVGQDIYCSTRSAEHRDCMALLEGCAVKVIKGV